jgi:hypothetical protein
MVIGGVPLTIILALLAAVVLALVSRYGGMPGVTRRVRRAVWCPVRDRKTEVELVEEAWDGKRVDVLECSVFDPPSAVSCEKPCLTLTRRRTLPAVPLPR